MAEHDETEQTDDIITEEEHYKRQKNHMLTQLDKIEGMNRDTMEQLKRRGHQPNALALTRIRTELLVTAVLGNQDSLRRLQFELAWQNELREYLASMYQNVNEKKLHIPGAN